MKRSWNGLLALGRSMAGLEGRARAYRVVDGGVPRFGEAASAQRKTTPATSLEAPGTQAPSSQAPAPSSAPAPAPRRMDPALDPLTAPANLVTPTHTSPPAPQLSIPASTSTPAPATAGASRGIPGRVPPPPARPVVTRSPAWRWFGWFRQRPVGHGKVEQIELRLEDVRPVRSSLEAEDFVVVNTATARPSTVRRNPFTDAVPQAPAPAPVDAAAPATAEAGRLNRLARWFRHREKTAHK